MKSKTLSLLIIWLSTFSVTEAQVPTDNKVFSQDIDTSVLEIHPEYIDNQDTFLLKLYDTVRILSKGDKQHAVAIYHLLESRELTNLTKYALVKSNILSSAETYHLLNKAIIGLKSVFATDSLDDFVVRLNRLGSTELGFSFNDRVIGLVKTTLLHGKTHGKKNKRIIKSVNSIINDTLFQRSDKLMPPVEIISAVMTSLRTSSVHNKRIKPERLDKLEAELNKYVVYYSALNGGRRQFQYGLGVIEEELSTLNKNIYIQLSFIADALNIPIASVGREVPLNMALKPFFTRYTKTSLQKFFDSLEVQYTSPYTKQINYGMMLRANDKMKEVNNQLNDLVQQIKKFDNIDNEYLTLLDSYYAQIVRSMNIVADSSLADNKLIMAKQKRLSEMKNNEFRDVKAAVDLKDLINNAHYIKYRYKVF
jgi:hypothetical protein